jgi:TPR repeat protein
MSIKNHAMQKNVFFFNKMVYMSPWMIPKTKVIMGMICIALLASTSNVAQENTKPETISWDKLANFQWDENGCHFIACNKDGSILAKLSKRDLEYRDALSGTLLSSHLNRRSESACLSADRANLLLCRIKRQKVIVDILPFGSGFIKSSIELPISIDLIEGGFSASLIQATPDGKYLIIIISSAYKKGEMIVYNLREQTIELVLNEIFDEDASVFPPSYDQGTETIALRNAAAKEGQSSGSVINIRTGTRIPIDFRDPSGKYPTREIHHLQFIEGHLIEINLDWAGEINVETGFRSVFATGLNDRNIDVLYMGNQLVFKDEKSPTFGILPSHLTFDEFKDELFLLGSKGFSESSWKYDIIRASDCVGYYNQKTNFMDPETGVFKTSCGDLYRRITHQKKSDTSYTKSHSDYEDLVKFWQRGFESKAVEWFKHKGAVRRGTWQRDYSKNCPYAACILGISLATGADGIKSVDKGKRLLSEAIDLGLKDAVVWLALFEKDYEKTFKVLSSARTGGSSLVLEALAQCYREGIGCEMNLGEALKLSVEAAELEGGAVSAVNVAKTYERGFKTVKALALINAGGNDVGSWQAGGRDYQFRTGSKIDLTLVESPAPEEVYQTIALSEKLVNGKLNWSIPAPVGSYNLRLHFIEPFAKSVGERKLEIVVQNKLVKENFDIYEASGGNFKAIAINFPVKVDDSSGVSIQVISKTKSGAILSGIELLSEESTGAVRPVQPDPNMVFGYFKKAAEGKALDSEFYVGMCYLNGVGVEQSNDEAFKWFQEGIATGSVLARYGMGLCLERGVGCNRDVVGAYQLFRECADLGLEVAISASSRVRAEAESIEADRELEARLRRRASRPSSQPASGGGGVNADAREAVREYRNHVSGYLGVNGLIFRGGY